MIVRSPSPETWSPNDVRPPLSARTAKSVSLGLIVLFGLMNVGLASAAGFCATQSPESVLECLATAYQARDLDAYAALLAPEFTFVFVMNGKEGSHWDRDKDLTATRRLFESAEIVKIQFEVHSGFAVEPGSEPDTWVLKNVGTALHVDTQSDKSPNHFDVATQGLEFQVRRVATPEVHYVITRWIDRDSD